MKCRNHVQRFRRPRSALPGPALPRSPRAAAQGFTLLEVLVSIAVLAFGLLGVAGLQIAGMRNAGSADARGTALYLAYDIIDRMHANRVSCNATPANGFPGDCYDFGTSAGNYQNFSFDPSKPPQPSCYGTGSPCTTPAQLAVADLWDWELKVTSLLPQGEAVVCNDSTPGDGVPSWSGSNTTRDGSSYACDGKVTTPPVCATCGSVAPVLTVKVFWDDRVTSGGAATDSGHPNSATTSAQPTFRRVYLSFQP